MRDDGAALTARRAAVVALGGLLATAFWSYTTCAHFGDPVVWILVLATGAAAGSAVYLAWRGENEVARTASALAVAAGVLVAVRSVGVFAALTACGR